MALLAAVALLAGVGCAPGTPGVTEASIVGGTVGGDRAVVWIYNAAEGGLCSGTLIAPRVVLTAKHCVQPPAASEPSPPSQFYVGLGDYAGRGTTLRVQSVRTTPGVWNENATRGLSGALIGRDIAVMVLVSGVSDVEPIPVRRALPRELVGDPFTATGFGQIPSGSSGTKYTVMSEVVSVSGDLIYVGSVTCQGDSGGPMITADREVAGVVSFGNGSCGSGFGAYNALTNYFDLIDAGLMEGGECVNDGAERCDGRDNDCNGMTDETCTPVGGACTSDDECVGNTCRDTVAGRVCTQACDARRPDFGCGDGLFCAPASPSSCEGLCIPSRGDGTLPNDAACMSDDACASRHCVDPGDGTRRCLSYCQPDQGLCFAGEVCFAGATSCGVCVPGAIVSGLAHALGEPCAADAECSSGACTEDAGARYCTRACDGETPCPGDFHCRGGSCVRGTLGGSGESCVNNEDCAGGTFCATRGATSWCTSLCSDATPCPDRFACVDAGGVQVCAPASGLTGDVCDAPEDCISGLCGDDGVCVRQCGVDAPCGPGFECARTVDGASAVCTRPRPAASGGGCAVIATGRGAGGGSWILGALLGLGVVVARRRRGSLAGGRS